MAVLGGGAAALTTAYYLSNTPELREEYEVTVYQLGWRLGGKGASGRGPHGRIEEHGLHVFWGFYAPGGSLLGDLDRLAFATMEQLSSAVMSGLQASQAISGHPEHIVGESDF